jgi:hypothetical protein
VLQTVLFGRVGGEGVGVVSLESYLNMAPPLCGGGRLTFLALDLALMASGCGWKWTLD